jgi:anti-sigma factor RsiW
MWLMKRPYFAAAGAAGAAGASVAAGASGFGASVAAGAGAWQAVKVRASTINTATKTVYLFFIFSPLNLYEDGRS